MRTPYAALLDAVLVLTFAAIGRRSHAEGLDLAGVFGTAWPFLVGAASGWVLGLLTHQGPLTWGFGVIVVACAVVIGMSLRHLSGAGVQPSFVVVATTVLGLLLVGWRAWVGWRSAA